MHARFLVTGDAQLIRSLYRPLAANYDAWVATHFSREHGCFWQYADRDGQEHPGDDQGVPGHPGPGQGPDLRGEHGDQSRSGPRAIGLFDQSRPRRAAGRQPGQHETDGNGEQAGGGATEHVAQPDLGDP